MSIYIFRPTLKAGLVPSVLKTRFLWTYQTLMVVLTVFVLIEPAHVNKLSMSGLRYLNYKHAYGFINNVNVK